MQSTASPTPTAGETLTPAEKKANHIQSEQKRRQVIREAFDELTSIVPGLTQAQSKSEAVVLKRTVDYIAEQKAEKEKLTKELEALERMS